MLCETLLHVAIQMRPIKEDFRSVLRSLRTLIINGALDGMRIDVIR